MTVTSVTISSKGQFSLPKEMREADRVRQGDVFRLERTGEGKYTLERLILPPLPKARLVRTKDGLLVFRSPAGAPRITRQQVKEIESETV